MPTVSARPRLHLRYDNLFFSGMAAVALLAVLIGFARTYFLAGLFRAPLPNLLVHIHGAAFTLWMIFFIIQISLITARRVDLHRRLGLLGFVLATVMILLGTVDRERPPCSQRGSTRHGYGRGSACLLRRSARRYAHVLYVHLCRLSQAFPTGGAQAVDVVRYAFASGRGFRPLAGL
jgi:hypothetical protein